MLPVECFQKSFSRSYSDSLNSIWGITSYSLVWSSCPLTAIYKPFKRPFPYWHNTRNWVRFKFCEIFAMRNMKKMVWYSRVAFEFKVHLVYIFLCTCPHSLAFLYIVGIWLHGIIFSHIRFLELIGLSTVHWKGILQNYICEGILIVAQLFCGV